MLKNISTSKIIYLSYVLIFSLALFFSVPPGMYQVSVLFFPVCLGLGLRLKKRGYKYLLIFFAFMLHYFFVAAIVSQHTLDADSLSPLIINLSILYAPISPNPWGSVFLVSILTTQFILFNQGIVTLLIYEKIGTSIILAIGVSFIVQFLRKLSLERNRYKKSSTIDSLTGLNTFNNAMLLSQKLLGTGENLTIILMDLDNFKVINDTYGHIMGNNIIVQFSKDLQESSPKNSICARLGGDEFFVILKNADLVDLTLHNLKERLRNATDYPCHIHFSYGISRSENIKNPNIEKLIQTADNQMYQYKMMENELVAVFYTEPAIPDKFKKIIEVLKEKDLYTYVHSQAVAQYNALLAKQCGMDEYFVKSMYIAGWLHEIGKIAVPKYILRKPGKLTDEEYALVQRHIAYGLNLLRSFNINHIIWNAIKNHHEKYDGSGYPENISGYTIPLEGRIISITNAYARITTKRIYRDKMPAVEALQYLQNKKGQLFDPELVDIFISNLSGQH